ncbi:hypothetical protein LDFHOB_08015 [Candidatus Electronema aureum]
MLLESSIIEKSLLTSLDYIPNPELGILFLGLFTGGLLGLGLSNTKANLRAVITAIGAGLGSGPLLFIKSSGNAIWSYPIGLVMGMLWLRLLYARDECSDNRRRLSYRIWAWIDIFVIISVTIASVIYCAI